ncbi:MAG: hypothetical protein ACR2LU_13480 [Luteitalea sp.]|nr:hypothetical protein [Acidobacteriota bacterium]
MLAAVRVSGLAYLGLVMVLLVQAGQGRPLLRPGPMLATTLAAMLVAWLGALAVLRGRSPEPAGQVRRLRLPEPPGP